MPRQVCAVERLLNRQRRLRCSDVVLYAVHALPVGFYREIPRAWDTLSREEGAAQLASELYDLLARFVAKERRLRGPRARDTRRSQSPATSTFGHVGIVKSSLELIPWWKSLSNLLYNI